METSNIPTEESTRRESTDGDADSSDRIPLDIICSNILTRVPVKSILQFRSVSKDWESSIRSSFFCKMHFTHSQTPHGLIHLLMIVHNAHTFTYQFLSMSCGVGGEPVTNFLPISTRIEYMISGSINGLSCFHPLNGFYNDSVLYICNPSTRKIITLPPNPTGWKAAYSFGVEPFTSNFKVLSLHTNFYDDSNPPEVPFESRTIFYIIGSQDRSWRPIKSDFPCTLDDLLLTIILRKSVCVNGIIHWMLASGTAIMTFCLKDETFGLMSLPKEATPQATGIGSRDLIQIGGCLTVIFWERTFHKQVWILEDYENQAWVKKSISFPFTESDQSDDFPYLISSVNTSELFLRSFCSRSDYFPFYDMRTKTFRRLRLAQLPDYYTIQCVTTYAESLFSLGDAQTGSDEVGVENGGSNSHVFLEEQQ